MLNVKETETQETPADAEEVSSKAPSSGTGKSYGRQVSVQELFDGKF